MKCIMTLGGAAEGTVKVLRLSDKEAKARVASGKATYCSKREWKQATCTARPKTEEVANA